MQIDQQTTQVKILEKELEKARLVIDHPHLAEQLYPEFPSFNFKEEALVEEEVKQEEVINFKVWH